MVVILQVTLNIFLAKGQEPGNKPSEAGPHAGDMPNIHVPESGELHIEVLNQMVSLDGLLGGEGTAIVAHQKGDDYVSNPAGDAGPRIACGVITK